MAGTKLTLDTKNLDGLHHRISGLANMDVSSLLPRLGEYLRTSTQDRFQSQTDPTGTPWQVLQPRTIKRKRGNPDKILTERDFLRRGIRYQILDKNRVAVGTNLVYAATHQYGRDNIPARPFLGLSTQDRSRIQEIIREWAADLGFS